MIDVILAGLLIRALLGPAAAAMPPAGETPRQVHPSDEARARRKSEVEAFVAKANKLIQGNNYDIKSTAHYKVKTDDPRFDVEAGAQMLESFRAFFDATWAGRAELLPCEEPSLIYLFYSRSSYRQLLPEEERTIELGHVGYYRPFFDAVAIHTDTIGPADLPDLIVHEAAHQLVQVRLYGPDAPCSLWAAEGLATYFGNTLRDTSGRFLAGSIGGKSVTLLKDAPRSGKRMGWEDATRFRRALGRDEAPTVDEILRNVDPNEFYGSSAREWYTGAWLLIHYLLHADSGVHAPSLVRYLKRDAAGDGGADVLYQEIGMSRDQLDTAFRLYVGKLKAK
ncbi:MAG TPA: DUF1570 domain-containing protein [Candidatus Polarisedimenticolia bacterium]|jgi:hypothetical protein